ncbi:MAG: hypothetical protein KDJ49_08215 [Alphaproteobacteria bacterium]|nr:hypothetical protein [Alphaproteobacteria bacterium]USO08352.1 MAG: hypothetical protein H6866_03840 [Rhodospirillales bacterium]
MNELTNPANFELAALLGDVERRKDMLPTGHDLRTAMDALESCLRKMIDANPNTNTDQDLDRATVQIKSDARTVLAVIDHQLSGLDSIAAGTLKSMVENAYTAFGISQRQNKPDDISRLMGIVRLIAEENIKPAASEVSAPQGEPDLLAVLKEALYAPNPTQPAAQPAAKGDALAELAALIAGKTAEPEPAIAAEPVQPELQAEPQAEPQPEPIDSFGAEGVRQYVLDELQSFGDNVRDAFEFIANRQPELYVSMARAFDAVGELAELDPELHRALYDRIPALIIDEADSNSNAYSPLLDSTYLDGVKGKIDEVGKTTWLKNNADASMTLKDLLAYGQAVYMLNAERSARLQAEQTPAEQTPAVEPEDFSYVSASYQTERLDIARNELFERLDTIQSGLVNDPHHKRIGQLVELGVDAGAFFSLLSPRDFNEALSRLKDAALEDHSDSTLVDIGKNRDVMRNVIQSIVRNPLEAINAADEKVLEQKGKDKKEADALLNKHLDLTGFASVFQNAVTAFSEFLKVQAENNAALNKARESLLAPLEKAVAGTAKKQGTPLDRDSSNMAASEILSRTALEPGAAEILTSIQTGLNYSVLRPWEWGAPRMAHAALQSLISTHIEMQVKWNRNKARVNARVDERKDSSGTSDAGYTLTDKLDLAASLGLIREEYAGPEQEALDQLTKLGAETLKSRPRILDAAPAASVAETAAPAAPVLAEASEAKTDIPTDFAEKPAAENQLRRLKAKVNATLESAAALIKQNPDTLITAAENLLNAAAYASLSRAIDRVNAIGDDARQAGENNDWTKGYVRMDILSALARDILADGRRTMTPKENDGVIKKIVENGDRAWLEANAQSMTLHDMLTFGNTTDDTGMAAFLEQGVARLVDEEHFNPKAAQDATDLPSFLNRADKPRDLRLAGANLVNSMIKFAKTTAQQSEDDLRAGGMTSQAAIETLLDKQGLRDFIHDIGISLSEDTTALDPYETAVLRRELSDAIGQKFAPVYYDREQAYSKAEAELDAARKTGADATDQKRSIDRIAELGGQSNALRKIFRDLETVMLAHAQNNVALTTKRSQIFTALETRFSNVSIKAGMPAGTGPNVARDLLNETFKRADAYEIMTGIEAELAGGIFSSRRSLRAMIKNSLEIQKLEDKANAPENSSVKRAELNGAADALFTEKLLPVLDRLAEKGGKIMQAQLKKAHSQRASKASAAKADTAPERIATAPTPVDAPVAAPAGPVPAFLLRQGTQAPTPGPRRRPKAPRRAARAIGREMLAAISEAEQREKLSARERGYAHKPAAKQPGKEPTTRPSVEQQAHESRARWADYAEKLANKTILIQTNAALKEAARKEKIAQKREAWKMARAQKVIESGIDAVNKQNAKEAKREKSAALRAQRKAAWSARFNGWKEWLGQTASALTMAQAAQPALAGGSPEFLPAYDAPYQAPVKGQRFNAVGIEGLGKGATQLAASTARGVALIAKTGTRWSLAATKAAYDRWPSIILGIGFGIYAAAPIKAAAAAMFAGTAIPVVTPVLTTAAPIIAAGALAALTTAQIQRRYTNLRAEWTQNQEAAPSWLKEQGLKIGATGLAIGETILNTGLHAAGRILWNGVAEAGDMLRLSGRNKSERIHARQHRDNRLREAIFDDNFVQAGIMLAKAAPLLAHGYRAQRAARAQAAEKGLNLRMSERLGTMVAAMKARDAVSTELMFGTMAAMFGAAVGMAGSSAYHHYLDTQTPTAAPVRAPDTTLRTPTTIIPADQTPQGQIPGSAAPVDAAAHNNNPAGGLDQVLPSTGAAAIMGQHQPLFIDGHSYIAQMQHGDTLVWNDGGGDRLRDVTFKQPHAPTKSHVAHNGGGRAHGAAHAHGKPAAHSTAHGARHAHAGTRAHTGTHAAPARPVGAPMDLGPYSQHTASGNPLERAVKGVGNGIGDAFKAADGFFSDKIGNPLRKLFDGAAHIGHHADTVVTPSAHTPLGKFNAAFGERIVHAGGWNRASLNAMLDQAGKGNQSALDSVKAWASAFKHEGHLTAAQKAAIHDVMRMGGHRPTLRHS